VQRRIQAGELRSIASGIVTSRPEAHWPALIQQNKMRLLAALYPNAVIGFSTAFNGMQGADVYLSYTYNRDVVLPGLNIFLKRAVGPVAGDSPWNNSKLYWPSEARVFLDNLTRDKKGGRNVSRAALEERLLSICDIKGEARLQSLREKAEAIAPALLRSVESKALSTIIGAILGSRPAKELQSASVRGHAGGLDSERLSLFDKLAAYLRVTPLPEVLDAAPTSSSSRANLAFLESYFSNFIEGTEFEIGEVVGIVFEGRVFDNRPQDSHDILGVYRQSLDPAWRSAPLSQAADPLTLLQERHADMMRERPGGVKVVANRAGNTKFVAPRLVRGTFIEAAKRLDDLPPGLPRALYAMFIVTEIHPFADGNGRIARLMMNAELSAADQCRIVVPTLYREPYLDGLRVATREGNFDTYARTMVKVQQWTSQLDFSDLDNVLEVVRATNAFETSLAKNMLLMPDDVQPVMAPGA
jgi:hypothetical protein